MALIEARELYRFFHTGGEEVQALRGVTAQVEEGEMVAVAGPSGSGKSTLLLCLAGLDEPDGGEVIVAGERMTRRGEAFKTRLRSRTMGIMLQGDNLFGHLTVAQNIALVQRLGGRPDRHWTARMLDSAGLAAKADALPEELSGGERARASLVAAKARNPRILILDEPTGEVDAASGSAILQLMDSHRMEGGCVVVSTHNAAIAGRADRTLNLRDGRLNDG